MNIPGEARVWIFSGATHYSMLHAQNGLANGLLKEVQHDTKYACLLQYAHVQVLCNNYFI